MTNFTKNILGFFLQPMNAGFHIPSMNIQALDISALWPV